MSSKLQRPPPSTNQSSNSLQNNNNGGTYDHLLKLLVIGDSGKNYLYC